MSNLEEDELCPICLESSDFAAYFHWIILPCRHKFHVTCFWQVINRCSRIVASKCPLCRSGLSWLDFSSPVGPRFNCIVLASSTTRRSSAGAGWRTSGICQVSPHTKFEPLCTLQPDLLEASSVPTIAVHPAFLWSLLSSQGWLESQWLTSTQESDAPLQALPPLEVFLRITENALLMHSGFVRRFRPDMESAI